MNIYVKKWNKCHLLLVSGLGFGVSINASAATTTALTSSELSGFNDVSIDRALWNVTLIDTYQGTLYDPLDSVITNSIVHTPHIAIVARSYVSWQKADMSAVPIPAALVIFVPALLVRFSTTSEIVKHVNQQLIILL